MSERFPFAICRAADKLVHMARTEQKPAEAIAHFLAGWSWAPPGWITETCYGVEYESAENPGHRGRSGRTFTTAEAAEDYASWFFDPGRGRWFVVRIETMTRTSDVKSGGSIDAPDQVEAHADALLAERKKG